MLILCVICGSNVIAGDFLDVYDDITFIDENGSIYIDRVFVHFIDINITLVNSTTTIEIPEGTSTIEALTFLYNSTLKLKMSDAMFRLHSMVLFNSSICHIWSGETIGLTFRDIDISSYGRSKDEAIQATIYEWTRVGWYQYWSWELNVTCDEGVNWTMRVDGINYTADSWPYWWPDGQHVYNLSAPGHIPANGTFTLDENSQLSLYLAPDLDEDGISDHIDPDIDGDGYENPDDAFPYDETEWWDTDLDGIGDNDDPDDDNDGVNDTDDAFPINKAEWNDTDGDGVGDNADDDDDGDGWPDSLELEAGADPRDNGSTPPDLDGDGIWDGEDIDIDNDGYINDDDAFPQDPDEWRDLDGDGIGDNTDDDTDGDNWTNDVELEASSDPQDNTSVPPDIDGDGIWDGADLDIDGDLIPNAGDAFPEDPAEWNDTDGDGIGDNADEDDDGDGWLDIDETQAGSSPTDAGSVPDDLDGDGIWDGKDLDMDGDGVPDDQDADPRDPKVGRPEADDEPDDTTEDQTNENGSVAAGDQGETGGIDKAKDEKTGMAGTLMALGALLVLGAVVALVWFSHPARASARRRGEGMTERPQPRREPARARRPEVEPQIIDAEFEELDNSRT